jgi:hypothetical protein
MKTLTLLLVFLVSSAAIAIEPIVINPKNALEFGINVTKKTYDEHNDRIEYIIEYPSEEKFDGVDELGFAQIHIFYSDDRSKSINIPQFGGIVRISSDKEGIELAKVTINYGRSELKRFLVIPISEWK